MSLRSAWMLGLVALMSNKPEAAVFAFMGFTLSIVADWFSSKP